MCCRTVSVQYCNGKGTITLLLSFMITTAANVVGSVIAHFICKWLGGSHRDD